ncbi:MAG: S41 family peptidase [Flavobacterium sp.]
MKKILALLGALMVTAFAIQGCDDIDDTDVPVYDFVWKGMNLYYLWKDEVPALRDGRFADQGELNDYLRGFSSPEELFGSLLYKPGQVDRFSVIFSDYRVLENALQGVVRSNGVEFGLKYVPGSDTEVFGYVRYILPGSDASGKPIERGDLFRSVNGTDLNTANYQNLLSQLTYTLDLATYSGGTITPTGEHVTLTKTEYAENPVYEVSVHQTGPHKIGYLMYNGFFSNYNAELNAAFGELAGQGITDLVLDLRYNGGGSVRTATYLGSMITGQFTGQLFSKQQWNAKIQAHYESNAPQALQELFQSQLSNGAPINSLNLTRVFILTSPSTASASELVINCLDPYIDVVVIGERTTGKNVGSVTLYDSDDFGPAGRSSEHTYAMQPIVLKTVNKVGFGDYSDGIVPETSQNTLPEDMANLGVLGSPTEPLFARAIAIITGGGRFGQAQLQLPARSFRDSKNMQRFGNEMYIDKAPDGSTDMLMIP